MTHSTLLLLVDGRFPAGGHAHSGGLEAAAAAGLVRDLSQLYEWLTGRLATIGSVEAAFAAAAWSNASAAGSGVVKASTLASGRSVAEESAGVLADVERRLIVLDRELVARTASPAQRSASRAQGRGLIRAARRCWPSDVIEALAIHWPATAALGTAPVAGPMLPIAFGVTGYAAGLSAADVTLGACCAAVQGPAWSSTRLLGLDPLGVAECLARLSPAIEQASKAALRWSDWTLNPRELPSTTAPLLELGAEDHATWEVRLFAS